MADTVKLTALTIVTIPHSEDPAQNQVIEPGEQFEVPKGRAQRLLDLGAATKDAKGGEAKVAGGVGFDELNVSELRALAKRRGLEGLDKAKKDDVVQALVDQADTSTPSTEPV